MSRIDLTAVVVSDDTEHLLGPMFDALDAAAHGLSLHLGGASGGAPRPTR